MKQIILITGGIRSGKSSYGQNVAESLSKNPIYLATGKIWDEDFAKRVKHHRSHRDENWRTIEEEIDLSRHKLEGEVVLLDCVTLWLTNIFHKNNYDFELSLSEGLRRWDKFISGNFTLLAVSNEVGMSIHPIEEASRKFADLQGFINQHIAKHATKVFTLISGIPLQLK